MKRIDREKTAFLYVRLSRDDKLDGDSYSIQNQKKLLVKTAKQMGYSKSHIFCDDGVSGVTMSRPAFSEMISLLDKGYASAVFVKDMSRLGRNYIEVGRLTEEYFPDNEIRLVAISDNVDTAEGENDLTPIRNLFNEWYAKDISKKRRLSNKVKGSAGIPLSQPPYGYIKNPDNPKEWIVEEEAAMVVRRIFNMTSQGYGTDQIAAALEADKVHAPQTYWTMRGEKRAGVKEDMNPYLWRHSTVIKILSRQEYCGDVINFKTYSKSFKNKKRIQNSEDDMMIFKDVHEAIVDRELWERVQKKRGKTRKKSSRKTGEVNMFSGLLKCADCGGNLHFHLGSRDKSIEYFSCANNNKRNRTCDKTHHIRVDFLEQVVLAEVRRLAQFVTRYKDYFSTSILGQIQDNIAAEQKRKERQLKNMLERNRELDRLFERLYEDNLSGKISNERYAKMSESYENEQVELSKKIAELKEDIEKSKDLSASTDAFAVIAQKYNRARKLTGEMLNELIEYIEVSHSEKIDGRYVQRVAIHYNCIGTLDIPKNLPISDIDVQMERRQGVKVNYIKDEEDKYVS